MKSFILILASLLLAGTASFTVAQAPIVNETEPNNTLETAQNFAIGSTLSGSLDASATASDDSDWFVFTTHVNGFVRFHGYPQSTLAIGLELWKEGMTIPVVQAGHYIYVGIEQAIEFRNLAKGTYYLRVIRHGDSKGSYSVTTQLMPPSRVSGEDMESNDSMNVATPVQLNTTITGHIGYSEIYVIDENDWYSLDVPQNGEIRIHGVPDTTLAMVMELWNPSLTSPLAQVGHYVYLGDEKTLVIPNLAAGFYKLRVNYASTYGSYEIFLDFQPSRHAAFEQNEPNDEPSQAIPLTPGVNVSSTIGFTNGVVRDLDDWYRFNISEDGLIRLKTHPDSTLAAIITLYTTGDDVIVQSGHYSFLGMDRVLEVANLQKGEYLVRITHGEYGSYDLILEYEPEVSLTANDVEPNDSFQQASSVPVNSEFSGRLGFTDGLTTDEVDFFRFETFVTGPASINAVPDSNMAVTLQLFNEQQAILANAGHYSFIGQTTTITIPELQPGVYVLNVGRGEFGSYRILIETQDTVVVAPEPLLSGRITDAVNGEPIPGAFVMIGGVETMTDSTGTYRFFELPEAPVSVSFTADSTLGIVPFAVSFTSELLPGVYTIRVLAEGYSPFAFNGLTVGGRMVFDASLSPEMTDVDLRFVLNWGAEPRDLDSHVITPDSTHVYYGSPGSATEAPFVVLDHDITTGYGPETVSFVRLSPGSYTYFVHLYSGEGTIATSAAVVQIYDRDGLLMTVTPPADGAALYWLVASVDGATGRVTLLNRYTDINPAGQFFQKQQAKSILQAATATEWTYLWQFGDQQTSQDAHPTHLFEQPGLYTVSVDVNHPDGRSAFFLRRDYIEVLADTTQPEAPEYVLSGYVTDAITGEPVIGAFVMVEGSFETMTDSTGFYGFTELMPPTTQMSFSADVTQGLAPLSVAFSPSFRDGFYTVHAFAEGYGQFTYTDLAADTLMSLDLAVVPATQDTTPMQKIARLASDPSADWQFFWGFGDGGTSEDFAPTHIYANPGIYSVFAEAIDTLGGRFVHAYREHYILVEADTSLVYPRLTGRVTNAVNGQPIVGATVTVGTHTTSTDSLGVYAFFELPEAPTQVAFSADSTFGEAPLTVQFQSWVLDGYYTIRVQADGFDEFTYNNLIVVGPTEFDLSLSPTLELADMRVVLNWGAAPRDLDSHIRTPDGFHVYYSNPGSIDSAPFTTLDHDVVDGYGPETITLVQRRSGTYAYYIHNYSGESSITTSAAVVRFYDAQGLLMSVEVPAEGIGLYWYVADIDGESGRITLINRIQEAEPGAVFTEKTVAKTPTRSAQIDWTYSWDFGDGNGSDVPHPEHTYTRPGVYSVSLIATLGDRTAWMTRRDYIHIIEPIRMIEAVNDTVTVVAGTIVRIDPMANDHLPDTLVVFMELQDMSLNYGLLMMTADQRGLIYASAVNARGTDSLRYTLHHQDGFLSALIVIHVVEGIVRNQAPVVALPVEISILEDSTLAIPMRKLVFDDHNTLNDLGIQVASVNPAVSAALSSGKDTLRISALPNWWGTSVLTLTATDPEGGVTTDHVTLTFIPVNDAPIAIFMKQAERLTDAGLVVDFIDQSHDALDPEGAITAWAWDFGDGNTSSQRHPSHTYTISGTFTVRLSVTDNAGLSSVTETAVVSEFTSVEPNERITEFALRGAYPNPFNPTTLLRIDVPETGDVVIEVYTSMGQRVTTLKETLSAGSHNIEVDALGWSSGVYLYTVRYRDQMVSSKMTLIK